MIISTNSELHQFAIKKLAKEINQELAEWRERELLWLRYNAVKEAWSVLLLKGFDDEILYTYKVKLERQYYSRY